MVARSTPPLRDISADAGSGVPELDPDSAGTPYEPIRRPRALESRRWRWCHRPSRIAMIGGGDRGGVRSAGPSATGSGSGTRQRPARPIRNVAATVDSVMDLAPVAMHLLANPLVRALALRVVLRQINRRIDH